MNEIRNRIKILISFLNISAKTHTMLCNKSINFDIKIHTNIIVYHFCSYVLVSDIKVSNYSIS